jgi:uncharacterized protein (TIGR00251 family)
MDGSPDRWDEVVTDTLDGVVALNVELQPNASSAAVVGINQWRRRLQVRVTSAAQKGAANEELLELLSQVLGVARVRVSLDSGARDRRKRLLISEIDRASVIASLEVAMEG